MDRTGTVDARANAAQHFHAQLRSTLVAGAKLTPPTLVKALRGAYAELRPASHDPFGPALSGARALAGIYAAWMETLDPQSQNTELRSMKHLSDAGWIEAQMIVVSQTQSVPAAKQEFLQRGTIEAVDFVIGGGLTVPQRNDLAWLSGFAAGLQGLSVGQGNKSSSAS